MRRLMRRVAFGFVALLGGLIVLGSVMRNDTGEVPVRDAGTTATSSQEAKSRPRVRDLDDLSCFSDETKYGRCPRNRYFGKTMAQVQAARKAEGKKKRAEAAAEARAEAAAAAEAARAEAERVAEEQAAFEAANAWIPDGWQQYSEDVYFQWTGDCDNSFTGCHGMDVVTKNGCSDLYVEIQLLDSAGSAVGYSNDTIGGLTPGQHAKLDFPSFEEHAQAKVTEINCF